MEDCIFCKIIKKEAPAVVSFEDNSCIVFNPLDQITRGHVLVAPKNHFQDIFDIDAGTLEKLIVISKKMANDIVKREKATGVNILHASGKDAQQSVPHFHLHIVPRYSNDGLDLWLKNKL